MSAHTLANARGVMLKVVTYGGMCAREAEHFPDSPDHPSFPTTVLKPEETLHAVTVWKAGAR